MSGAPTFDQEIEAMKRPFVVLLIAMPAVKAQELEELVSERGWVGSHFQKEFSDKRDLFVTAAAYMAVSARRAWTMTILLSVVALVWANVALSLLRPPLAPNRNQEEIQDTLAATVVYPLP